VKTGLQFLIEGAGGFQNANVIIEADEARQWIRDWTMGGMRKGVFSPKSGEWAIDMGGVRAIFMFSLTPPPGGSSPGYPGAMFRSGN